MKRLPWHARAAIRPNPGSYKLISYQRVSGGISVGGTYADTLGEPSRRCASSFRISGDLGAMVKVNFTSGCSIKFVSGEASG